MAEENLDHPEELEDKERKDDKAAPPVDEQDNAGGKQGPALPYPVVGFGASAGGLQALREILENLDPDTGMAFVLVTHLSPAQKSFLSEIVERYTKMRVLSIEHGMTPGPNHLYVLQPNQTVALRNGRFQVEAPGPFDRHPKTIDKFFFSLAADQKNHAIGVVLSGADADGALGLKEIKGEGGIALVQSPESAMHAGMPLSSIAGDHVDLVVPPREIAIELGRLAQEFFRPEVQKLQEGTISPEDQQVYQKILQLCRNLSGLDLRQYKPETIRRRIARRMLLLRIDSLREYYDLLEIRKDELSRLNEDVLINVTRFFRDPPLWDALQTQILPALVQERPQGKALRIWCAGCSSGEETYSLAIVVLEYLTKNGFDVPVQIFGTDASDKSIDMARQGIYPETILSDISQERLRRFFVKVDRGWQVSKRVRDVCVFARQNLQSDPPFSHIDLLSCRNVMIYFNQALQRQVLLTFHYALENGGYLLLGMSEGMSEYTEIFNAVDRKNKIYIKSGSDLPVSYEGPRLPISLLTSGFNRSSLTAEKSFWPEVELQRATDGIVLARYGPPGLVIDEQMNVIQSRGQTSPFVEISPGAVSWNLFRIVKEGLIDAVTKSVEAAMRDNVPASAKAVMFDEQNQERQVRVDVLPVTTVASRRRSFMILFQSVSDAETVVPAEPPLQLTMDEKERLIAQLRQELASTRYHLQSLAQEREARTQELISANEEIQSANEELQSTNEELETTKEELQSANEELQTVNDELQQRNAILTQTSNDLVNLLNSVNIPLLMLTNEFRVRQFTPPMERLLNVRSSDLGRNISEIRLQLSIEDVMPILKEVLETLNARECEVQDRDGRWHLLRIRPYRTAENKIEGLVMVLIDIDQLRRSQQSLVDAHDFTGTVVESVPMPLVILDQQCTIRAVNSAFRALANLPAKDLEGKSLPDLALQLWGLDGLGDRLEDLKAAPPGERLEFEHTSTISPQKTLLAKAQALVHDGDRVLIMVIENISLRLEAERRATEGEQRRLKTSEDLRVLTAHLLTSEEEIRQRIARDLHDDISQRLSFLEILLEELRGSNEEEEQQRLERARELLSALNTDVRQISHQLHPAILSDLGLSAALQALVKEFGEHEAMPATYSTDNLPESWSPESATALYRIAQEALRNVAKHAGKTHVKVVLSGTKTGLQLTVKDFGIGFDLADYRTPGLGLTSMQERARLAGGILRLQSALGEGTTLTVEVPREKA